MKRLILVIALVFFLSGCISIDDRYVGKRIRARASYGHVYMPFYGVSLYNPFWYYDVFGYYYGYYDRYSIGGYNRVYPYYIYIPNQGQKYGKSVITKRQLRSSPARVVTKTSLKAKVKKKEK